MRSQIFNQAHQTMNQLLFNNTSNLIQSTLALTLNSKTSFTMVIIRLNKISAFSMRAHTPHCPAPTQSSSGTTSQSMLIPRCVSIAGLRIQPMRLSNSLQSSTHTKSTGLNAIMTLKILVSISKLWMALILIAINWFWTLVWMVNTQNIALPCKEK